jgi:hypothetical protein
MCRLRPMTVLFLVAAFGLASCGGGNDQAAEPPSTPGATATATVTRVVTAAPTPSRCAAVLTQQEVEAVAKRELDDPVETSIGDLPSCTWNDPASDARVVASHVPAVVWAKALPNIMDIVKASGIALAPADVR